MVTLKIRKKHKQQQERSEADAPTTGPGPDIESRPPSGSLGAQAAPSERPTTAVAVRSLSKTFASGARRHRALDAVCLDVEQGEMVALIGASGSGKSTLMRHLSGLVQADRDGDCLVAIHDQRVQDGNGIARGVQRIRCKVGFIFQQFNLVGRLTLLKNVCLGMLGRTPLHRSLLGIFTAEEKRLAMAALDRVGMAEYANQRASTLSGGQQQRGAIARAMVQGATVLLADEPIASLDPASSTRVMDSLAQLNRDGVTVLVCLHQVEYARRYCPRTIALRDGVIVFDGDTSELTDETLHTLYGAEAEDACFNDAARSSTEQAAPVAAIDPLQTPYEA